MIELDSFGKGTDTTEYHAYDAELPTIFEELKALISQKITGISIEHIGSSSIPGIGGRNVLDVAIPSSDEKRALIIKKLKQLGFEESPFPHYLPILVSAVNWNAKKYFILLYVLSPDSAAFKDWITFRNYMRKHPKDAKAYDNIKQQAIKQNKTGGEDYQNAKSPFLRDMLAKIKTEQSIE